MLLDAVELGFMSSVYTFKKMTKPLNVGMKEPEHGGNFQGPPRRRWPWDHHFWEDLLGSLAQLDLVGVVLGPLL